MIQLGLSTQFRIQFYTLSSLCTSYPTGFGFSCLPDGSKGIMTPNTVLVVAALSEAQGPFSFLYSRCFQCHCPDDAPDEPRIAESGRPACAPEAESEPDETTQPGSPAQSAAVAAQPGQCPQYFDGKTTCSPLYGSPDPFDCDSAYEKLHSALTDNFTPEQAHGSDEHPDDFRIGVADEVNFVDRSDYARLAQRQPAVKLIPMPFTVFSGRESLQIG